MVSQPIKHLLTEIIDYAGLFPPAKLDMAPAVAEFGRQHRSTDAWLLARFVVPVPRLDEFAAAMKQHRTATDGLWRLSVLVAMEHAAARQQIDAFNQQHQGAAIIDAIETKPANAADIASAMATFPDLEVYLELDHQVDPAPMMTAVAEHGGRAKIRTGGITPDAIPSAAQVSRFIRAAAKAGIPFKATAGLHHPMRGNYRLTYDEDAEHSSMHGFLNLFLAAAWVRDGNMGPDQVEALLEERHGSAIEFSNAGVAWREFKLSAEQLAKARKQFSMSYGSCSFQEPVDDLRTLHLL